MKPLLALLLSALTLSTTAWARIGEKAEQLEKRYGTPVAGAGTETIHFKKNDVYITAVLWKGVCHVICFSNYPPTQSSLGDDINLTEEVRTRFRNASGAPQLTPEQIQKLLEANGGAIKWERDGGSAWHTKNGWYLARMVSGNTLRIATKEFSERKPEGKDKPAYDPAKRIEGF